MIIPSSSFDCVLAVDAFTSIKTDYHNAFEDLKQYQQTAKDWLLVIYRMI
jgi:para-aminobenzoate synthetase component 1